MFVVVEDLNEVIISKASTHHVDVWHLLCRDGSNEESSDQFVVFHKDCLINIKNTIGEV